MCAVPERHAWTEFAIERHVMIKFAKKMPRRTILQALIALPALSLLRGKPAGVDPDEIVEVNGWILRRSDLA
jgi:hypothetical protein